MSFPFPPGPPEGTGIVIIRLTTGLELPAEYIGSEWWSHLNENPDAAPLDASYVESWRPVE